MTVTGARTGSGPAHSWPLIGRSEELERIATVRTNETSPAVAVIAPAGVGKSRLARAAAAAAAETGAMVCWVQGTRSAAAVPLAACAELLRPDARADDPLLQLQRTAKALREQAAGRPIVLGVDDAQRLDPASAALILQLTITGTAFVLATVRSSEPCPDAVQSLWKDAGAERLELGPLSEAHTSELVEAVLGGPVEQRARQWIWEGSQGNVLYVHESCAPRSRPKRSQRRRILAAHAAPRPERLAGGADRRPVVGARWRRAASGRAVGLRRTAWTAGTRLAGRSLDAIAAVEAHGNRQDRRRGRRRADPPGAPAVRRRGPILDAGDPSCPGAPGSGPSVQRTRGAFREDALLIARWLLDAGDPVPVELSAEAARAAIAAGDPELGERLGRFGARRRRRRPGRATGGTGVRRAPTLRRCRGAAGTLEGASVPGRRNRLRSAADHRAGLGLASTAGRLGLRDPRPGWWEDPAGAASWCPSGCERRR